MKPAESENALKNRLGHSMAALRPRQATNAMFAFYAEQRFEDVSIDEDGDMLLFEWGKYAFGGPESFRLGITRQFAVTNEDEPYQLRLTLHFTPTAALQQFDRGNKWCHSPAELPAFEQFVESSAPFKALADATPSRIELYFGQC